MSVTNSHKFLKTDGKHEAKAVGFVCSVVVRMMELRKAFRENREFAGLAQDGGRG